MGKFLLTHKASLVGIFETRVKQEIIVHSQKLIAPFWKWVDNSLHWQKVRIMVGWDESRFCCLMCVIIGNLFIVKYNLLIVGRSVGLPLFIG